MSKKKASSTRSLPEQELKDKIRDYSKRLSDHWMKEIREKRLIPKTGDASHFWYKFEIDLWQAVIDRVREPDQAIMDWAINLAREEMERCKAALSEPADASRQWSWGEVLAFAALHPEISDKKLSEVSGWSRSHLAHQGPRKEELKRARATRPLGAIIRKRDAQEPEYQRGDETRR